MYQRLHFSWNSSLYIVAETIILFYIFAVSKVKNSWHWMQQVEASIASWFRKEFCKFLSLLLQSDLHEIRDGLHCIFDTWSTSDDVFLSHSSHKYWIKFFFSVIRRFSTVWIQLINSSFIVAFQNQYDIYIII